MKNEKRDIKLSVMVTKSLNDELDQLCENLGVTRSNLIYRILATGTKPLLDKVAGIHSLQGEFMRAVDESNGWVTLTK